MPDRERSGERCTCVTVVSHGRARASPDLRVPKTRPPNSQLRRSITNAAARERRSGLMLLSGVSFVAGVVSHLDVAGRGAHA
jgi:hypothetical protein